MGFAKYIATSVGLTVIGAGGAVPAVVGSMMAYDAHKIMQKDLQEAKERKKAEGGN